LTHWDPVIIENELPPVPPGTGPAETVHGLLAPAASRLLRPYDRPPVVWVLTRAGHRRAVLSVLAHHVAADGWSIGVLWREIAATYAAAPAVQPTPAGPDPGMDAIIGQERAAASRAAARAAELTGWPAVTEIPSDMTRPGTRSPTGARLVFGLSGAA